MVPMLGDAPTNERATWDATLEALRTAHQLETPRPAPRGVELEVDMSTKVMMVQMDLSALVNDWSPNRVVAPGEQNHRWLTVVGRIFGDPRWEGGSAVTMYGVVSAAKRTLIGMSMEYDLGRKDKRAP